jgi:hypothetical protein
MLECRELKHSPIIGGIMPQAGERPILPEEKVESETDLALIGS